MFKGFWKYWKNAEAHSTEAGKLFGETCTNAGKTASSLLNVAGQALTGDKVFEAASGKICNAAGVLGIVGYIPPLAKVTKYPEKVVKIALDALCGHPTASLLSTIALTIALAPEQFIEATKNLAKTFYSAGETLYEVLCVTGNVAMALGNGTLEVPHAAAEIAFDALDGGVDLVGKGDIDFGIV